MTASLIEARISEAVLLLGVVATCLVVAAAIADRCSTSGRQSRNIWRLATLQLLAICGMEFMGFHAVVRDLAGPWPSSARPAAHRSLAPNFPSASDATSELPIVSGLEEISHNYMAPATPAEWYPIYPSDDPPPQFDAIVESVSATQASTTSPSLPSGRRISLPIAFGCVWLLGSTWVLVRHVGRCASLSRLCRSLRPLEDQELQRRIVQLAEKLGLRRRIRTRWDPAAKAPMAYGVARPTLVLPGSFQATHHAGQQDAMLAHELTHLAGWDSAWQHLAVTACAVLWWQPLSWYVARRLRLSMEFAADESAAIVPSGPGHLAECLVTLGRRLKAENRYGFGMAGAGFRSALGTRVARLLRQSRVGLADGPTGYRRMVLCEFPMVLVVFMCVLFISWALPCDRSLADGDVEMQLFARSWKQSLVFTLMAGLSAPAAISAQESDAPEAEQYREVEVEEEREVERDRRSSERRERREQKRLIDSRAEKLEQELKQREQIARQSEIQNTIRRLQHQLQLLTEQRKLSGDVVKQQYRQLGQAERAQQGQFEQAARQLERQLRELSEQRKATAWAPEELTRRRQAAAQQRVNQPAGPWGQPRDTRTTQEHLKIAAENLRAAGLLDQAAQLAEHAAQLAEQAKSLERAQSRAPVRANAAAGRERGRGFEGARRERSPEVVALRADVRRLQVEMAEIKQLLKRLVEDRRARPQSRGADPFADPFEPPPFSDEPSADNLPSEPASDEPSGDDPFGA